jgi:hypothetical protein
MGSKDTAVAALPYVNQFTSAETFFLAGMSPVGTVETCRRHLKMSAHRGSPEVVSAPPQ